MQTGDEALSYTYDANGNITSISKNNEVYESYTYDAKNQLASVTRGDDTWVYSYDLNGNILSVTKNNATTPEKSYGYTDPNWKDKLTSFNGSTITYDAIGNPLQYRNNINLTWVNGRKLASFTKDNKTTAFTYDGEGNRIRKVSGNTTVDYIVIGGTIYGEIRTENGGVTSLHYLFDENGARIGFVVDGDKTYYYRFNLQGDVTGIYDTDGTLVAQYVYDAWGKLIYSDNTDIANLNPIRYRGYYYDIETGLYYVSSRYYDPEIGRWINADGQISGVGGEILGYNMFAYCMNNPVNMSDPSGNWPKWATKVLVGVAVIAAAAIVTVATGGAAAGTLVAAAHCIAAGALKGAIVGAVVGAATGAATSAVAHRVTTGSWEGAGEAALEGAADGFVSGAITGAITGGRNSNVCFIAGTAVLSSTGFVAIETIRAGDKVWAENPETGQKELKAVVQTFVNETEHLVHVFVKGEEIVTTPKHPFYSPVKGWTAACKLRAGDILVSVNGEYVIVERIQHEILEAPITVYNFEVADFHTYYVGKRSVLVHNLCTQNSSRRAAMREAKRSVNIPMSQEPNAIQKIKMIGENGKTTFAKMEIYGNKYIRNDLGGHLFSDGMKMGRHFNAGIIDKTGREISNNIHFFY